MVKLNFWQNLPVRLASADAQRRVVARPQDDLQVRARPQISHANGAQTQPAASGVSPSATAGWQLYPQGIKRSCHEGCTIAVPELTRSIDIKLNAGLSLRGHRNPIASSHRTCSRARIHDVSDPTPRGIFFSVRLQMVAGIQDFEQNESSRSRPAWVGVWHLWTVVIPRRSIAGRLVYGKVWRRHDGRHWTYKKFVEYANDETD
jgi:hypothetical protein